MWGHAHMGHAHMSPACALPLMALLLLSIRWIAGVRCVDATRFPLACLPLCYLCLWNHLFFFLLWNIGRIGYHHIKKTIILSGLDQAFRKWFKSPPNSVILRQRARPWKIIPKVAVFSMHFRKQNLLFRNYLLSFRNGWLLSESLLLIKDNVPSSKGMFNFWKI